MRIVYLNKTGHEHIVNKMLNEDMISNPIIANLSLKGLGLQIKSVSIENNETVVYIDSFQDLLLG